MVGSLAVGESWFMAAAAAMVIVGAILVRASFRRGKDVSAR
jgi:hypothetical protein